MAQNVTTGTGLPSPPAGANSRPRNVSAEWKLGDRKTTTPSVKVRNVSATRANVPGPESSADRRAALSSAHAAKCRWTSKKTPFNVPQATKVHAAPCQSPHNVIASSKLNAVRHSDPRLPPRGKKT